MGPDSQGVALLRDQVLAICAGTAFVMVGVAAWVLATVRRGSGVPVFVWLGAWSAIYGIQELVRAPAAVAALPGTLQSAVPYVNVAVAYLVPVVAMRAWLELTRGSLRLLLKAITAVGLAIAGAGIGTFLVNRDAAAFRLPNVVITVLFLLLLVTVAAWAHDPAQLLRKLGSALERHLRGQYVTAAYLWLDVETRTARYAAAGHPPLLLWRAATGTLARIESNGLLFGVAEDSDYPACEITFDRHDRFVLYTDGLTEPESATGEPFGDFRLEQILRECRDKPAEEVARQLLAAVAAWPPASVAQQDDITFLIIDVL